MSRALLLGVVVCGLVGGQGQSLIEEAVTGFLGRTAKMGRNIVELAKADNDGRHQGSAQGILGSGRGSAALLLRPEDGTIAGGFFRGFIKDVDDNGNLNKGTLLQPEQHQVIGGLLGGLFNGGATTAKPVEEIPGLLESLARQRQERRSARLREAAPLSPGARVTELGDEDVANLSKTALAPAVRWRGPNDALIDELPLNPTSAEADGSLNIRTPAKNDDDMPPPVLTNWDALRRDVARAAPECSNKARAQLSKVLGNFRKGVLDCVGVEDADLSDVLTRLRQVLLIADRLPTSLVHNLNRCVSRHELPKRRENATQSQTPGPESAHITRIPPKLAATGPGGFSEESSARCIIQALADARDRLHKIPSQAAAFSRRVAFLLAGTKSDARVRACVASQLTSMAHPLVATTRMLAGCVLVGPEFSPE